MRSNSSVAGARVEAMALLRLEGNLIEVSRSGVIPFDLTFPNWEGRSVLAEITVELPQE